MRGVGKKEGVLCWWFFIWCLEMAFSDGDGGAGRLGSGTQVGFRDVGALAVNSSD